MMFIFDRDMTIFLKEESDMTREISIKTHFYEVRQLINKWQLIEIGVFE